MNNQDDLIDLVGFLSFFLGLQNLKENREQSAHNDIQSANENQAQFILNEINKKFDEQNNIIEDTNKKVEQILINILELKKHLIK